MRNSMTEEKKTINDIEDKQAFVNYILAIVDNLSTIKSFQESNSDIIKEMKADYGISATAIRAAANALYKSQKDELEAKQTEVMTIIDLVESFNKPRSSDID